MKALALIFGLALVVGLAGGVWVARTDLPSFTPATSVEVLAHDGHLLRAYTVDDGRWRLKTDPARVDATYLAMLLAYEDKRFFQHHGVDPLALARAGALALWRGQLGSGGSTLTMQVARLLEEGPTGTWAGKLRQIRLALAMERVLTKQDILALYLHLAPMGGNLEGLRAGTYAWLGREPERLTKAQAALMVALPQSPAARAPDRHAQRAIAARDRVLARAHSAGVISTEGYRAAISEPLSTTRRPFPVHAPHLADRLRAAKPAQGLHRTTLRSEMQIALEELARTALPNLPAQASTAILVADLQSGSVLASVGSADYLDTRRQGFVDMTQALRSPGSTLKPLIYGLAFSDGLAHPETLIDDRPKSFAGYAPQNFDRQFRGLVSTREALQLSLNLPVVDLTASIGPARVLAALRQAGVRAQLPGEAGLALALGGVGVSLEGLVQLYAAIARGGEVVALSPSAGRTTPNHSLISPEAAWHLGDIMASTPRDAALPDWRIAFKTGTSYGHRDAWAIGFDGVHVVGVWVGRPDGAPVPGMYGGDVAAPLLFGTFARLGAEPAPLPPAPPATLTVQLGDLPKPLQRFGARVTEPANRPELAFPPDGAVLRQMGGGVMARVAQGRAPFTWFANDMPVLIASPEREAMLALEGPGFVRLSVVDADGYAARVQVELR